MPLTHRIQDRVCEITVQQCLHRNESQELLKKWGELLGALDLEKVVLDMQICQSISSAGIGAILTIAKEAKAKAISLALINCDEKVKYLFNVTGIQSIVPID